MRHTFPGRFPLARLRRPRQQAFSRALMAESHLSCQDLIYPVFIHDEQGNQPIAAMPGQSRLSLNALLEIADRCVKHGIPAIMLFPVITPEKKCEAAVEAYHPDGLIPQAIRQLKAAYPELGVLTDVALDPYTSHGQDGVLNENGEILNDESVDILIKQALVHATAGADMVCPSDMMDGRIGQIRAALEQAGFKATQILAYSAKYASHYYGPFREAVGTKAALGKSNKATYQLDPRNAQEALREVELDIAEGADFVMIKPGMPYLDILQQVKSTFNMPTLVYQVSGEYAMLKAASEKGWLDEKAAVLESLMAFKRAGANAILTYYALEAADWLVSSNNG